MNNFLICYIYLYLICFEEVLSGKVYRYEFSFRIECGFIEFDDCLMSIFFILCLLGLEDLN